MPCCLRPAPQPRGRFSFRLARPSQADNPPPVHAGRRSGSHVHRRPTQRQSTSATPDDRRRRHAAPGHEARPRPDQELGAPSSRARALEQATNLSNLPFAIDHVALMPDAHAGYGMPIGGVLFADRAVVPYAIGVDIGCGVALVETDLTVETLAPTSLDRRLEARWPGRAGRLRRSRPKPGRPRGGRWPRSALSCRRRSRRRGSIARCEPARARWVGEPLPRGPAGRGRPGLRHAPLRFAEPGQDDLRRVPQAGARAEPGLALAAARTAELAYLPVGTDDFAGYWSAMEFALRFAEVNRLADARRRPRHAFGRHTKVGRFERLVDVHHNYAAWEHHVGVERDRPPQGRRARPGRRDGPDPGLDGHRVVRRRGARQRRVVRDVPARGRSGDEPDRRAEGQDVRRRSTPRWPRWASRSLLGDPKTVAEEAAFAYKDIESVMAASASLVRPIKRLTPLGVVKG